MASPRSSARRRQRSVRVTVSVSLLAIATVLVVVAVPTGSLVAVSAAAIAAIVLGWAALRMMWTEVLQSRRENAVDKAAAATAYRDLFSQRAAEHAEFTSAMTERLAVSQTTMRELEGVVVAEQRRASAAESKLASTTKQLRRAEEQVDELKTELTRREAEEADALASWEGEGGEVTAADLVAFDEQVQLATRVGQAAQSA